MEFALATVTLLSLIMTGAMGIVTWRLVREERRRSAARLAALASELQRGRPAPPREPDPMAKPAVTAARQTKPLARSGPPATPSHPPIDVTIREREDLSPAVPVVGAGAPTGGLFGAPVQSTSGFTSLFAWFGAAAALIVAFVSAVILAFPDRDRDRVAEGPELVPVELLALEHDRQGSFLAISGSIRNPPEAAEARQLAVMAMAFDRDGAMVASGRAPVEGDTLLPGTETVFEVSLPAERIARYRVSFVTDEATVPHVDRRAAFSAARPKTES